jgi:predicted RNase H-like nuclease
LASIKFDGCGLRLGNIARLELVDEILGWIQTETGGGNAVAAVDAPLVIRNATGIREAERELNKDYRRFDAGCHAANLGRPFAANVTGFSDKLARLGFGHGASMAARAEGRFQIEVHPHAASVSLFGLERIVKYKRGLREARARGLRELRSLLVTRLPALDPPLLSALPEVALPEIPSTGSTKAVEDKIDAVICAYVAAYWWFWGAARNRVYGTEVGGYIVVPRPVS